MCNLVKSSVCLREITLIGKFQRETTPGEKNFLLQYMNPFTKGCTVVGKKLFPSLSKFLLLSVTPFRKRVKCFRSRVIRHGFRCGSGVVQSFPTFSSEFHLHWKFQINLGYHIYSKFSHPLLFSLTSILYYL